MRPILYNLLINDLEFGVSSEMAKFAYGTSLLKVVKRKRDCEELQRDLSKLGEGASKWQMCFNGGKCKVMHVGSKKNPPFAWKIRRLRGDMRGVQNYACCWECG